MKAEFQLEFTKLRDRMAEEVAKTTAQMAQELSQAREELSQARNELECSRLQLDTVMGTQGASPATRSPTTRSYAEAASTAPASLTSPTSSPVPSASPEPVFCTIDTSRVPEDYAAEATPTALRKTIEQEMRASGNQPSWRCVAVTRDGRNTNRMRVRARNEEELKRIKDIVEARKVPGTRVLRDQLYPVKVDSINRTAVLDQEGTILPGALEALGQENEVQIAKIAWLSRKDIPKRQVVNRSYHHQAQRKRRDAEARRTMVDWLAGSWADLRLANGGNWSSVTGLKAMQQDSWSCGLQMLETLRVILLAGGQMPAVERGPACMSFTPNRGQPIELPTKRANM